MSTLDTPITFKFKHILLIIFAIILTHVGVYLLGYHIGNKNIKTETETKIEYVTGGKITGSVYPIEPISVNIPTYEFIQSYRDTIRGETQLIIQPVDSANILKDYLTQRNYELTLFDSDTIGNCKVNTAVQYNKITKFDYTFTPVQKVITNNIYNKNKLDIFGGVGVATNGMYEVQVGAYFNHFGGSAGFVNTFDNKDKGAKLNIYYKF